MPHDHEPQEAHAADHADEDSVTYHHDSYEGGQHWFSAEHDGEEIAHAHVIEQHGYSSPYAEIKRLFTNPHYRQRGIGSRLLDNVAGHFGDRDLLLKPYPTGRDGDPDDDELRDYYSNQGFEDYQLKDGDSFHLSGYMTRPGSRTAHSAEPDREPAAADADQPSTTATSPAAAHPRSSIQASCADALTAPGLARTSFPAPAGGPPATSAPARDQGPQVPHRARRPG
jgi:GNAT superfamily N-acetyltransferase